MVIQDKKHTMIKCIFLHYHFRQIWLIAYWNLKL